MKHEHKGCRVCRSSDWRRKEPIREDELRGAEEPEMDWEAEEERVIQWYLNGGSDNGSCGTS